MATYQIQYTIYLSDAELVSKRQNAPALVFQPRNGSPGAWVPDPNPFLAPARVGKVFGSPANAAMTDWSAPGAVPNYNFGVDPQITPILFGNVAFTPPCIASQWIVSFGQTTRPYYLDEFTQDVGGFWGWLFNSKDTYVWVGTFQLAQTPVPDTPGGDPKSAIAERRWIDGFEHPELGEGGSSTASALFTRAASRHADGYGLALRGTGASARTHSTVENGAAASRKSWERFYIRPRGYPTAPDTFWRSHGSVSAANGVALLLNAAGRIAINQVDASNVFSQIAVSSQVLAIDAWYRIDVLIAFANGPASAGTAFELWINGVQSVATGWLDVSPVGQFHASSAIGNEAGDGSRKLGIDIDDWMNATIPALGAEGSAAFAPVALRTGNDWKSGSRMASITATGFGASNGTFVGDWRVALQEPAADSVADLIEFTSSTSADVLDLTTNATQVIENTPGSQGAVALVVGIFSSRAGTGNGQVGYAIDGAAPTYVAMVDSTSPKWNTAALRPSGLLVPSKMTPLEIFHTKAATASQEKVYTFCAEVELMGLFGQEDVLPAADGSTVKVVGNKGIHTAPYPRSAWAKATDIPPVAPVAIVSDTYVGNGTGKDLIFPFPPTFIWIRHVAAANNGTSWWSSMFAAHHHLPQAAGSNGAVQVLVDPAFEVVTTGGDTDQLEQYLVRVVGDEATVNKNGDTYAYTAFCDPGMRFTLNGAITWPRGTLDRTTKLERANFTPDAVFFHREVSLGTTSGVDQWYKGPGHGTSKASRLDQAETDAIATFAKGAITTKSALHFSGAGQEIAFAAWRQQDGSFDPGVPKVVQIWSYTGTGVLNPDGVRVELFPVGIATRPMFVIIVPHDAAAVMRDPSHTGTTSTTLPATPNAADGIVGATLDVIYVGADLNHAGVVYDVFMLPGCTPAGNGGWSIGCTTVPVPPIPPPNYGGCDPIPLAPTTLPAGQVGVAYDATIVASGGAAPYVYDVADGALPAGLSLSSGGVISGTPTEAVDASFTIRATDANDCTGEQFYTVSFNADTCPPIAVSPGELPAAVVGVPYTQALAASGGAGPYVFSVSTGALPEGFTLSASGVISGTLVSADVSPFLVRATDINGCFGEQLYSLVPDEVGGGPGCIAATLAIVNRALSRIGQTKPIVDILTDQTPEALMARLHYANDVDTVLRDFPWPFATKYATLSLVAGSPSTPANGDWRYSYRQPNACIFERRIVVDRTVGVDTTPPPFQLSSDAVGGLILTNQVNAVLEFTARPSCAALRGDSLFRDALTWRVALSLAPALTRIEGKVAECEKAYATAIALATMVLRPGNPGAPQPTPTVDICAGCQIANTNVVNRALIRIGAQTIRSLALDESREAASARVVFEDELRTVLRDHPWAFATSYLTPAFVAGTEDAPVNADWTYSYRLTANVLVRRVVSLLKRAWDPNPPQFRIGRDTTGELLFVNLPDPKVELTVRPEGAVAIADAIFRDAFAWRLAAALAPSLAQIDPAKIEQAGRGPAVEAKEPNRITAPMRLAVAKYAEAKYQAALSAARTADAREQQQDPITGDADWIAGRN